MSSQLLLRLVIAMMLLIVACDCAAAAQEQRVVVLYDERIELPGLAMLDQGIESILSASSDSPIEIYRETLDLSRFNSRDYLQQLRDHLELKYQNKKVDAVVGVMGPSLDFLLENADVVFPGAAIVFCGIDRRELVGRVLPRDVTGVLLKREFAPTLQLALKLHPNTERVVVVAGASEFDTRVLTELRTELKQYESDLEFTYLTRLPFPKLLEALSRLPPRSIVLYSTLFRDVAGNAFVPHEVAEQVSRAASVPVYGFVDQYLGRGIVGGYLYSLDEHGVQAGRLTRRVLSGEAPASIPYIEESASTMLFDARQLSRWGISEDSLPARATVRFREPTLWNQ